MAVYITLGLLLLPAIFGLLVPSCTAKNVLLSGEVLRANQSLTEGSYAFTMQSDCNLVLYDNGSAVWASGTYGRASNCFIVMRTYGDLVMYSSSGPIWATNTGGEEGSYACVLQSDRNVVVYGGALWETGTNTTDSGILDQKRDNDKRGRSFVVVNSKGESSGGRIEPKSLIDL